jgi:fructokinase
MSRSHPHPATIVCFGEALWDVLPRGIFLGGAPLNVAYHLSRHGVRALPVSAVGRDFLGDEALRRIAAWDVATGFISKRATHSTGTVRASLDTRGVATYQIVRNVAWDHIPASPALLRQRPPAAIVFGTLALRGRSNQEALTRIFATWPNAVRVLDLNLRAPFDRGPAIEFALRHAQILKLNDEELARLAGKRKLAPARLEQAARALAAQRSLARICVTAGEHGGGLLWDGQWTWERGRRVDVRDTIGSGDAFLAAFLAAIFTRGKSPASALALACRMGEFVAGCDGATPPYRIDREGRPRH